MCFCRINERIAGGGNELLRNRCPGGFEPPGGAFAVNVAVALGAVGEAFHVAQAFGGVDEDEVDALAVWQVQAVHADEAGFGGVGLVGGGKSTDFWAGAIAKDDAGRFRLDGVVGAGKMDDELRSCWLGLGQDDQRLVIARECKRCTSQGSPFQGVHQAGIIGCW